MEVGHYITSMNVPLAKLFDCVLVLAFHRANWNVELISIPISIHDPWRLAIHPFYSLYTHLSIGL